MRESRIEQALIDATEAAEGAALKLGTNGWPDRLVLLPGGVAGFAELKRPGGVLAQLQAQRLRVLRELGFLAEAPASLGDVAEFLARLRCVKR